MSRLPRIAFVIDDLGHGGAQRQLLLLAAALKDHARVHVAVLSDRGHPYAARLRAAGASVSLIPRRSTLDLLRVRALIADLRTVEADIVHGVLDASNSYAWLAALRLGVPAVLSLRSDRLHLGAIRARVLRSMLRSAPAITANSEAGRRFLVEDVGVDPGRVVLVPNIVVIPHTPSPAPETPHVACVGRAVALKRFDAVIDALAIVRRLVPATRLTIMGDGPERARLQARADQLGLSSAVTLAGEVADASTRMSAFTCLVIASTHEGMPNAALEALAAGVPLVAPAVGDLPAVIEQTGGGVITRDTTPESLASGIVKILSDPSIAERTAREAPGVIGQRHAPEAARDILLQLYARLQKQTGASTSV
jgi:glycosyltransferase involved in cell wall biosynthesis